MKALVIVILLATGFNVHAGLFDFGKKSLEQEIEEGVAATNKQSPPGQLDKITYYDGAFVGPEANAITYKFTVSKSPTVSKIDAFVGGVIKESCGELIPDLKRGVIFHYTYYDTSGQLIYTKKVDKQLCGIR